MLGFASAVPLGIIATNPTAAAKRVAMSVTRLFRPLSTSGRTPFVVVRLPGELTGSGTTGPTPPPRRDAFAPRRLGGDSPQVGWFPGSSWRPRAATALTRRDTRMDTGLVHRHGHLSRHTNHTPSAPQNFDRDSRDISVIRLTTPFTSVPPASLVTTSSQDHPLPGTSGGLDGRRIDRRAQPQRWDQTTRRKGVERTALVVAQGQLGRWPEQHGHDAVVAGRPSHQAGVAVDS